MDSDVIVPIAVMTMIASIAISWIYFSYRSKHSMHETLQASINQGNSLSVEQIKEIARSFIPRRNDLRGGAILIAISLAMIIFGMIDGDVDFYGVAAFPGFVGIALLLLHKFGPRMEDQ